jgi:luciferase family oxidoreductase group 1
VQVRIGLWYEHLVRTPFSLSVLDLSPIASGDSTTGALRNTIDLARHADALGLARYWLAEHHNAAATCSTAPEVMIGQVAAATRAIRVGSGGIMLPNHSALKVAETFRVLHALFPGRIDLGLGRAPGTDVRTANALRRGTRPLSADDFPIQLDELLDYLEEDGAPRSAWTPTIAAIPAGVPMPELWILGSSEFGARLASERGFGFAFAHQLNQHDAVAMLRSYRDKFRPSRYCTAPHAILAVSAICADTDAQAEDLATSADLAGVRAAQGLRDLPLPTVAEARAHVYDAEQESLRRLHRERLIVGSVEGACIQLTELAEAASADELMVMTHVHDHEARKRSYALLARAFGVAPRSA